MVGFFPISYGHLSCDWIHKLNKMKCVIIWWTWSLWRKNTNLWFPITAREVGSVVVSEFTGIHNSLGYISFKSLSHISSFNVYKNPMKKARHSSFPMLTKEEREYRQALWRVQILKWLSPWWDQNPTSWPWCCFHPECREWQQLRRPPEVFILPKRKKPQRLLKSILQYHLRALMTS